MIKLCACALTLFAVGCCCDADPLPEADAGAACTQNYECPDPGPCEVGVCDGGACDTVAVANGLPGDCQTNFYCEKKVCVPVP